VANEVDSTVSAYRIAENGALSPVIGSPFAGQGTFATSLAVDPFSRSVYVTNTIANPQSEIVSAYSINPTTGALTPVAGSPFPGGISVAVDLLGRFVYVANVFNYIWAYRIDENGALTPVPGSPFPDLNNPFSVTVDRLGRFAYVVNSENGGSTIGSVSAFRIEPDGALTPVKGSPFSTGGLDPLLAAVDQFRSFVYVTNFNSNNVSAFRIEPDGALTPVAGSPFPAGFGPVAWRLVPRTGAPFQGGGPDRFCERGPARRTMRGG
jgi:6-phosphogluconolactonase